MLYIRRKTPVSACFLDASRTFNLVSHDLLLTEAYQLVSYTAFSQNDWSCPFNGVRLGGVLSPVLFTVYIVWQVTSSPETARCWLLLEFLLCWCLCICWWFGNLGHLCICSQADVKMLWIFSLLAWSKVQPCQFIKFSAHTADSSTVLPRNGGQSALSLFCM